jgi:hypothetical protein
VQAVAQTLLDSTFAHLKDMAAVLAQAHMRRRSSSSTGGGWAPAQPTQQRSAGAQASCDALQQQQQPHGHAQALQSQVSAAQQDEAAAPAAAAPLSLQGQPAEGAAWDVNQPHAEQEQQERQPDAAFDFASLYADGLNERWSSDAQSLPLEFQLRSADASGAGGPLMPVPHFQALLQAEQAATAAGSADGTKRAEGAAQAAACVAPVPEAYVEQAGAARTDTDLPAMASLPSEGSSAPRYSQDDTSRGMFSYPAGREAAASLAAAAAAAMPAPAAATAWAGGSLWHEVPQEAEGFPGSAAAAASVASVGDSDSVVVEDEVGDWQTSQAGSSAGDDVVPEDSEMLQQGQPDASVASVVAEDSSALPAAASVEDSVQSMPNQQQQRRPWEGRDRAQSGRASVSAAAAAAAAAGGDTGSVAEEEWSGAAREAGYAGSATSSSQQYGSSSFESESASQVQGPDGKGMRQQWLQQQAQQQQQQLVEEPNEADTIELQQQVGGCCLESTVFVEHSVLVVKADVWSS